MGKGARGISSAEAYTAVGGVTGAIEKTAEAAYERLTAAQKDAARRLFLRLVTPGEGQEDTRARSVIPNDPQQREVIKLFSDPKIRLLVTGLAPLHRTGDGESDGRATVEVAHEALIQRGPTLQAWISDNRDRLRARAAILARWRNGRRTTRPTGFCSIPAFSSRRFSGVSTTPAVASASLDVMFAG